MTSEDFDESLKILITHQMTNMRDNRQIADDAVESLICALGVAIAVKCKCRHQEIDFQCMKSEMRISELAHAMADLCAETEK